MEYDKLARRLEKNTGAYINPNQVKRYLDNHPELKNKNYQDMYRALHRYFLKFADEMEQ